MFTLKIENARGVTFELSHDTQNYIIAGVQGLTRPPAAINTTAGGGIDGTFYNSARLEQRNIVIDVILCGDIEGSRQRLYNIFPARSACTVYFKNKNRDVKIEGYVETLEGDLFQQQETMQISIICPRPYFEGLSAIYTELSNSVRMLEFPFSIEVDEPIPISEVQDAPSCIITNSGDTEAGAIFTVTIHALVATGVTCCTGFVIYNNSTGEHIGITYSFTSGDRVTICTKAGQLSAVLEKATGGTVSVLRYLSSGSKWIKLQPGENELTMTRTSLYGDTVQVNIEVEMAELFGGV